MKNLTDNHFTYNQGFLPLFISDCLDFLDPVFTFDRFMYLMDRQTPSYRTFGYFINEVLQDSIEQIFYDINQAIFEEEHVDLQHIYIDGSKFESNANKYTWVWKKATEKSRYRLYDKITVLLE